MIENLLIFLIFLSVLIIVHEFGHFIFAKILKVGVEEFGLGFPPRIFSFKFKETLYSLNLILFGGFVKLRGETDINDPQGFLAQPPIKKILIVLGGVLFNIIFAYFIFSFGYLVGLPEYSEKFENITILQVYPDSPAEKAGLKIGDQIIYFRYKGEDIKIDSYKNLRDVLKNYIGEEIIIGVKRGPYQFETKLIPSMQDSIGPLGIAFSSIKLEKKKFPQNFYFGFIRTYETIYNLSIAFKDFFIKLFKEAKIAKEVVGPLGIYDIYTQMRILGLSYVLHFTALVSLNLALINILPFPALDGGRFFIYLGEFFIRRKIPVNIENIINILGFAFLIFLMILITIKDILKKISK